MSIESWTSKDQKEWDAMTVQNRKRLDSTEIDPRYPYSKQVHLVKLSANEAFGIYGKDLKITNSFLFDLRSFIEAVHIFQSSNAGELSPEKLLDIKNNAIAAGNSIIETIIDYNIDIDQKIESDLMKTWKTRKEARILIKEKYDRFLQLLREKIAYERQ